ncbi:MAG: SufD family Fe-S cluster assembly protein [Candidatus Thermoplasmatota archaeon]|nr:SufD family Fe-S cluster assembly protein [Candidatus Thermoplasmatota archaeon]MCL5790304.1 SufD family Fe-S cluster assembly protein [Candidatus Thermoplasmatota archaeon]
MSLEEILKEKRKVADSLPIFAEHDSPSVKNYTPLKENDLLPILRSSKSGCAGMQRNITTHNGSPCRLFGGGSINFLPLVDAVSGGLVKAEDIFNDTYDKMSAINQGYFNDGFYLGIPSRFQGDKMINILHTGDRDFNVRNFYSIGSNTSAKILENFVITGNTSVSQGTVIRIGENSSLDYFLLEDEENTQLSYLERTIFMERYSTLRIHHLSLPGKKSISRFRVIQVGEHAESGYYGAALGKNDEHLDLEVYTDHRAVHGKNDTAFKGILGGKSSLIFRGYIRIEEKALNVESFLLANLLLLTKEAVGNALPVLEIFNGDVKAKHGESVSNISEEQITYLMSRGLDPRTAKKAVIEGFISPIIYPLPEDISRKYLQIVEEVIGDD